MSELVVFIFTDQYRGLEVLNELRRRDGLWPQDLNRPVVLTLDSEAKPSVHMSLDLSKSEAVAWREFGEHSALFVPLTERMAEVAFSSKPIRLSSASDRAESFEALWWYESLQDAENFRRDLSASITANSSTILMLLRTPKVSSVLETLRNYGSTIVHTTISTAQDETLACHLAGTCRSLMT